jgi:hypothetical protein
VTLSIFCVSPSLSFARNPHFERDLTAEELKLFTGSSDRHEESEKPTRFAQFNRGWHVSFKSLEKKLSSDRDYVTWIIAEPKTAMDLRSAENFRTSFMSSVTDSKSISHMMIAWSCHDERGKRLVGGAALTGEDGDQTQKMILGGWGMTPIYAVFGDGHLDTAQGIGMMVGVTSKYKVPVAHVSFEVTRENCQNMLKFFKTFLAHPRKPYTRFGLNLDPLNFEGGGCGSFAAALLSKAGVLTTVIPHFWRGLRASQYLMGMGLGDLPKDVELKLPAEYIGRFNYVWLGDLQLLPWTANDGPLVRLVDPEMGILALRQVALYYANLSKTGVSRLQQTAFAIRKINGSSGIAIDDRFDLQAARVTSSTRKELGLLTQSGMKITPVTLGSHWGLLVAR